MRCREGKIINTGKNKKKKIGTTSGVENRTGQIFNRIIKKNIQMIKKRAADEVSWERIARKKEKIQKEKKEIITRGEGGNSWPRGKKLGSPGRRSPERAAPRSRDKRTALCPRGKGAAPAGRLRLL